MTQSLSTLILLAVCLVCPVQTLQAAVPATDLSGLNSYPGEYRVALVIGNSTYPQAPLVSPANDARDMTEELQKVGFHVINLENASAAQMFVALREFGDTLRRVGGIGLFYYAGHGVQLDGENYLVPVNTDVQRLHEIKYQSLNLNQVLDELGAAGNRLNIVILDACRNNPFTRNSRSLQNGLAPINYSNTPSGTYISFATGPGQVAIDGDDNGLFTKHLLANMNTPGLPIEQVFKRVRAGVMAETDGAQIPWENSSLTGDFFFQPKPAASPQVPVSRAPTPVSTPALTPVLHTESKTPEKAPAAQYPQRLELSLDQLQLESPAAAPVSKQPSLDMLLSQAQQQLREGQFKAAQKSLDQAFMHYQSANLDQLQIMTGLTQSLTDQMLNRIQRASQD
ncbi:MAG: caspase family protein [Gammaproteobacteria bacterium]